MGMRLDTGIRITGWCNISLGNKFTMMRNGELHSLQGILLIGDNVAVSSNVCIDSCDGGRIEISNDVLIAQNVVIRAADHRYDNMDIPINRQGHTGGEIFIGEGVWIGANSVITKNVHIGEHAIVGAGAVVTKNVPPFAIVGGVPAKLIRMRIGTRIFRS